MSSNFQQAQMKNHVQRKLKEIYGNEYGSFSDQTKSEIIQALQADFEFTQNAIIEKQEQEVIQLYTLFNQSSKTAVRLMLNKYGFLKSVWNLIKVNLEK
jgi:hypothetical protein